MPVSGQTLGGQTKKSNEFASAVLEPVMYQSATGSPLSEFWLLETPNAN